jgi:hypothetical protein
VQNYICQPYYKENKLRFYPTNNPIAATPYYTLDISSDVSATWGATQGINDVVIYKNKIFVSVATDNNQGGVLIYNYADIYPTKTATFIKVKPGTTTGAAAGLPSAGMAIDPKTGDLYVPTFSTGVGDSGVFKYTAASNYAQASETQFASFTNDNSVAEICANLAFDTSGNLWMTTWSPSNNSAEHFLICYKGLDKNKYYKITNTPAKSYNTTPPTPTPVHLLSAPEGIAFDPDGNLWLGNNNDDALTNNPGEGTLVKIDAVGLSNLLSNPPNASYTVPNANVNIKYIPSGKLGGLIFDGNTIYVNDQGQNQGDDFRINGIVWKWDVTTPFNPTNFKASGIKTTYPGNGGSAFVQPLLLIKDNSLDSGLEPNTTTTAAWLSQDIWVRQTNDGKAAGNNISQNILGGQSCYVYVNVSNKGITPTSGIEQLKLYWAKASTGLGWKAPWDGSQNSPLPKLGEPIGVKPLGAIDPGSSNIIEFPWIAPNPIDYSSFGADDDHFCLLARLETQDNAPFGMTYPEQIGGGNTLILNVLNNNKIAWRNIHITKVARLIGTAIINQRIIAANYSTTSINAKLTFELLNSEGQPMELGAGKILLSAKNRALEKLNQTEFDRENVRVQENGQFKILNIERGIDNIILQPRETLPLTVEYIAPLEPTGVVLTVRQFAQEETGLTLIGGQTFVFGKVKGFPTDLINDEPEKQNKFPWWLWLILFLLLLAIILFKN